MGFSVGCVVNHVDWIIGTPTSTLTGFRMWCFSTIMPTSPWTHAPPVPATLICEPFQWGPVWDVWSTMLIGPWNPYTERVWTGVFFYKKSKIRRANFFYLCLQCTHDPTM